MTPSTPNLSQRQVMLSFAYLAYCGEQITTPNPEATILGYINAAIPQIPPISAPNDPWAVVWGPAVYTMPGALYQDNMMFVAQNQTDPTQFAIAVRGTNFVSDLDWLLEDFDVLAQMNWPPGATTSNPPGAMISESTSIDLQILLTMQGTVAANNTQSTLMSFLKSQASAAGINVCVTGHSLGGCAGGTLALYLKENQGSWDGSGKSNVSCITFAAPTAGNTAFAAYSDTTFKGGPYPPNWDSTLGATFDAVRCTYDVAPQAWIASNLSSGTAPNATSPLFTTYGSNLDFSKLSFTSGLAWNYMVNYFFPEVAGYMTSQNYQQPENNAAQVPGTFNPKFAPADDSLTTYIKAFVAQAAWQHGNSYPTILGVPSLLDPAIIVPG